MLLKNLEKNPLYVRGLNVKRAIDVVNNRGTFGFSLEKFRTSLAIFGNFRK